MLTFHWVVSQMLPAARQLLPVGESSNSSPPPLPAFFTPICFSLVLVNPWWLVFRGGCCRVCWVKALFPHCPVPSQGWMQAWHLLCYTSITRFSSVSESLPPVINAKLLPRTFSCFRGLLSADQRCCGSECSWACACPVRELPWGSPAPVGMGARQLSPCPRAVPLNHAWSICHRII